jgi:lipopolysaccharide biosynthesis glycosyltransferase
MMDASVASITDRPIIAASAIDEGYLPFALVVANSIARSKGRRPVEYHVVYCGPPSHWALPRLEAFKRRGLRVVVHRVPNRWGPLGNINGFPPASFLRASIPDVLDQNDRAIYLDVDLVVEADLAPLFDADLQGNPVGATQCVLTVTAALNNGRTFTGGRWTPTDQYFEQELGLVTREQKLGYIQSGVQLLDLVQLRAIQYADRLEVLAAEMRDRLAFVDQCATNKMLAGHLTLIDSRWNISPFALDAKHETHVPPELVSVIRHQRTARGILHFGGRKPWRHPTMPGSWRWWLNTPGSGAFPYIVMLENSRWRSNFVAAVPKFGARAYGFARQQVESAWHWLAPRLGRMVRDPVGTSRRVLRRLGGMPPER